MSKFLNLAYNKWHGVISAFIMVFSLVVIPLLSNLSTQAGFLLSVAIAATVVLVLQGMNESFQANSKTVIQDYGSWENFQKNSKDDWKWTVIGMFAGLFIGTLIFILIEKLCGH